MQFGVQFFPALSPRDRDAASYFADCLAIAEEADALGFTHARTVEHYFEAYGGYSPNPIVFLSAHVPARQVDAARYRRGAAGVQQPAQARGRDRHARRDLRRTARRGLCARIPAARISALRRFTGRVAGAVSGRPRPGRPAADAGSRKPSRPVPFVRERHLAAAPDPEAAAAVLHRGYADARVVRVRRASRLRPDDDSDRPDQAADRALSRGLAREWPPGRRQRHDCVSHVLPRERTSARASSRATPTISTFG